MGIFGTQDYDRFLQNLNETTILDLCTDILAFAGHKNIRITDGPGDGQRDIHSIDSDGNKFLTQSKYHRNIDQTVSAKELGEVVLGMVRLGYKNGLFITNAKISPQAKRDCLNDYPDYSVDYLEGREITQKIFENLILKAIWYDGQSLEKISYTILVPILARDLDTDKPLPMLPRHAEILDGNIFKSGRSEIQIKFQRSKIGTQVFGEYRSPKVKTFGELGSSHVSVTEAILSGVIHSEDIVEILTTLGNEIVNHVKSLNPEKRHFAILFGKPGLTPLGGKSSGARIELQDIEPKTLVYHNGLTTSEIDWILPQKDSGWMLPKRPSVSQAEWIRWYNLKNDICLDVLVDCPPSDEIKWQFVEHRNFVMKWWKASLFMLVQDSADDLKEIDIPEPTSKYRWDDKFFLYVWLHPTLNSPIFEFPIESEHEPLDTSWSEVNSSEIQIELMDIRTKIEGRGGVFVEPEKARHMVAMIDRDPYPDIELAEFSAKHLAYDVYKIPTPIDPLSRRFQFTACWVIRPKTESTPLTETTINKIIDRLRERAYTNLKANFFSDTKTESKEDFILAEIEVYPIEKFDSTISVLSSIEKFIVETLSEIEAVLNLYAMITKATRVYWEKEIILLF